MGEEMAKATIEKKMKMQMEVQSLLVLTRWLLTSLFHHNSGDQFLPYSDFHIYFVL